MRNPTLTINQASHIQVIDRAALLLDAIARYRRPVSLKILTAETGLHRSTAHRILGSLAQNGLVEKNSDNHYRLGLRLVQLGTRLHTRILTHSLTLSHLLTHSLAHSHTDSLTRTLTH